MMESIFNFLASDFLFRIMVWIFMVTIVFWMKHTNESILLIYKDMLLLNKIKENKKDE